MEGLGTVPHLNPWPTGPINLAKFGLMGDAERRSADTSSEGATPLRRNTPALRRRRGDAPDDGADCMLWIYVRSHSLVRVRMGLGSICRCGPIDQFRHSVSYLNEVLKVVVWRQRMSWALIE